MQKKVKVLGGTVATGKWHLLIDNEGGLFWPTQIKQRWKDSDIKIGFVDDIFWPSRLIMIDESSHIAVRDQRAATLGIAPMAVGTALLGTAGLLAGALTSRSALVLLEIVADGEHFLVEVNHAVFNRLQGKLLTVSSSKTRATTPDPVPRRPRVFVKTKPTPIQGSRGPMGGIKSFVVHHPIRSLLLGLAIGTFINGWASISKSPPAPPLDLRPFTLSDICRATIATVMAKPVEITIAGRVEQGVAHAWYVRADDGTDWHYRCRLPGERVLWATATGRWRFEDNIEVSAPGTDTLRIRWKHQDGSISDRRFTLREFRT